jgi:hypothetical protein
MMLANGLGLQGLTSVADTGAAPCTTASHECSGATEQRLHRVEGIARPNDAMCLFKPTYSISNLLIRFIVHLLSEYRDGQLNIRVSDGNSLGLPLSPRKINSA